MSEKSEQPETQGTHLSAEPILSTGFLLGHSDGRWQQRGQYIIWSGKREASEPAYVMHEWIERGVLPIPSRRQPILLHRVPAGRPYHVARLFGFWIVNDCDTLWFETTRGDTTYYTLITGGVSDRPSTSSCLWVCPKCAARFAEQSLRAPGQYDRFLHFALERVRAFNADQALRTCPRCAAVHPPVYGFYESSDTPEERAARAAA